MRKKFYFLLFVMTLSFVASAQRFEYQLGLKGGLGADWIRSIQNDYSEKDNGLCYKFGMTGIYNFGENYGFSSGFTVIGTSFSYKNKAVDELEKEIDLKHSFSATYCQIPLLLKMRTDAFAGGLRFLGEIGYGFNILVDGQYKLNGVKTTCPMRDVCSSLLVHLGFEMEVLNRSVLQFIVAYDNIFSSMMTMSTDKLATSNLCFELGFLF